MSGSIDRTHVRFGSNSEVAGLERDVRSTLKSRRRQTAPADLGQRSVA